MGDLFTTGIIKIFPHFLMVEYVQSASPTGQAEKCSTATADKIK